MLETRSQCGKKPTGTRKTGFVSLLLFRLSILNPCSFFIIILLCRSGHAILWKCFATGKCRRSNCTRVLSRNSKRMGFDIRTMRKGYFFYVGEIGFFCEIYFNLFGFGVEWKISSMESNVITNAMFFCYWVYAGVAPL